MIGLSVLLLPLFMAIVVALVGVRRSVVRGLALASGLATFIVALFLPGSAALDVPWIPGFGMTFALSAAGASSVLVMAASLIMIPALLYASVREERSRGFIVLLLLMQAGLNGIFLARDLIAFYVFWEGALIPSMLMLGMYGREKRRAAVGKYLVYAVTGSFLMLISILALRPLSGAASYGFADLLAVTPSLPAATQTWLFVGLALGMLVKVPLWPVHSWLIDFNDQNHVSGSADVTGSIYKVGGFGFFAWAMPLLPIGAERVAPVLLVLAVLTALYGALVAVAQTDLKRLLSYASLSHMGIVGVGLFGLHLAGMNGAMYLLAAQMLATGGMFLISGMLHERRGGFELERFGGLARGAPLLASLSLLVLFSFIGVPGLGNFPGEFLSLLGAFQNYGWLAAFATLVVIVASVYGLNMHQRVYFGEQKGTVPDLAALELVVLIPVVAGILWFGLAPAPQLQRIETQSSVVLEQIEAARSLPPSGTVDAALLPSGGVR